MSRTMLSASLLEVFGAHCVGASWSAGKAWDLFRAGARVTFFGAKKVTKETFKSNSNLLPEAKPGFFDETSLSHRKTMHILCIALRVSDQGIVCRVCKIIGTLPSVGRQTIVPLIAGSFTTRNYSMS
ncbi:MAG: hypothetical protein HOP03_04900 [Lysobacter sp.]|nr:hypothetical protein [Lysobacter sp.]